jgi:DNA gyrase subunit A
MSEFVKQIVPINIEHELKRSYLEYAMSVIVGRALPDVRDGLKPVHRRVLFAMHELNNDWNKAYKKSARVVGDVIGKYHPHGDTAVYDTVVRMAQPFALRYLLVDGQGNFGSVDGDSPAAMRYTEIRMSRFAHALLADLEKETVDFAPNYDGTEFAPVVLPTRVPNLLVNGSSGIAVGMATNIPPHNLNEIIDACLAVVNDPEVTLDSLMEHVLGPDFPTAGIIYGRAGIVEAYRTGRGRIYVRAKIEIEGEENSKKQAIIVTELPYQVNKARLIEKIAELVKDKKIEGITGLRDESDKDGMRIVIELRRDEVPEIVLNHLFAQTQMQVVFGINMVALIDGRPQVLNLKELIEAFLRHRREVVTRRTLFELKKARERAHVLEGLSVALANIDEMIALIKTAADSSVAKEKLLGKVWQAKLVVEMLNRADPTTAKPEDLEPIYGLSSEGYRLSPVQAQAILDLRLHRLTGLEQDKILSEYRELLTLIDNLLEILSNPERLMALIRQELLEVKEQFGDKRRTEIIADNADISIEDLITQEEVVVTLSHEGYVKTQPVSDYQAQHRGGRGKAATSMKEEDFIERLVIAHSHSIILCFSSAGKVYWLKTYQIPQASRIARGRPMVNLLPLGADEKINAILPVKEYSEDRYIVMVTAHGIIKKIRLSLFSRPRSNGIIALDLDENDKLVGIGITQTGSEIMLFTSAGKVIRFPESQIRPTGRTARGVRGIRLKEDQTVIALIIPLPDSQILTVTENGYGKRTPIKDYRITGRGGQGVISMQMSERNGAVVGAVQVLPGDEIMLMSDKGTLVRTRVDEISLVGRNTQGVRLIQLNAAEKLVEVQRVDEEVVMPEPDSETLPPAVT